MERTQDEFEYTESEDEPNVPSIKGKVKYGPCIQELCCSWLL